MPIEFGTTIAELDSSWPLGSDFVQEGDNHLRLLKSVLKAQFPGSLGDGFAIPILSNESELNWLQGLTSNVQDQIDALVADDNLKAPIGTVMVFYMASPPLGWTQHLNDDNSMLRLVTGAGGGAGGTDDPISFDGVHSHTTNPHTLTIDEMPSHSHNINRIRSNDKGGNYFEDADSSGSQNNTNTLSTGGGSAHEHGDTGEGGATFEPRYVNVIMAIKT